MSRGGTIWWPGHAYDRGMIALGQDAMSTTMEQWQDKNYERLTMTKTTSVLMVFDNVPVMSDIKWFQFRLGGGIVQVDGPGVKNVTTKITPV